MSASKLKLIYVVVATDGEYDDASDRLVCAYEILSAAEEHHQLATAAAAAVFNKVAQQPAKLGPVTWHSDHDKEFLLIDGKPPVYRIESVQLLAVGAYGQE